MKHYSDLGTAILIISRAGGTVAADDIKVALGYKLNAPSAGYYRLFDRAAALGVPLNRYKLNGVPQVSIDLNSPLIQAIQAMSPAPGIKQAS